MYLKGVGVWMGWRCLECVPKVYGMEGVGEVSERVWKVCRRCQEGVWKVSRKGLRAVRRCRLWESAPGAARLVDLVGLSQVRSGEIIVCNFIFILPIPSAKSGGESWIKCTPSKARTDQNGAGPFRIRPSQAKPSLGIAIWKFWVNIYMRLWHERVIEELSLIKRSVDSKSKWKLG